ncbi:MAG: DMT family transporter [Microcoleus vaginatus WJT46-NPBG5]|jgi:drug/metabolite transporter (DMT)-like permease|nr:DMT family transporter [Microcoleus vaginatus WJT46-NPBG5]
MQLHQTSGRWRLGLALSLITVFLWGILPIALTVTLQALDVYTVTWFRFLLSFTVLVIYLAARQQLPAPQKLRSMPLGLLAIAIIFLAINYLLFQQGLIQTSPANAQVLVQLAPVLLGLGGLVVFKERYTLRQWAGVAVLTSGFSLFFHEKLRNLITNPTQYLAGSGLIVIAAATWAVYALAQKQLLHKLPSASIMLMIYAGCTLVFSPFAAPKQILTLSHLHLGMLLFCALNTALAYGAFAESLEHWEASRVSAMLALTPVVTLMSIWVVSFLAPNLIPPERLTILGLMGAILVVCGSITIALGKRPKVNLA